ncbi:hypothetical protein O3M35_010612 [Rhynocoris fuscipes]|uniref:Protein takeout n=1 Tax=Rhynocoris fuscipes TaxID=488301 RepID=A0AAW1D0K0_9HEMI
MDRRIIGLTLIVICILVGIAQGEQRELCSLSAKNLPQCLITSIQSIIPILVKGIPRYGANPMDPMHIDKLDLSHSPGKTLNVKHKFTNVEISGLGSAVIRHVRLNPQKVEVDVNAILSKPVVLTGNYISQGKIISLPIRGGGKFNITLVNMRAVLKMKGHEINKNGKRHIVLDSVKFPFKIDKMILNFENLLRGNKLLSETLNNVLNENWEAVLLDMKPSFEEAIGSAFQDFANKILSRVPVSSLVQD